MERNAESRNRHFWLCGCVVGVVRRCCSSVVAMERRSLQSDVSRHMGGEEEGEEEEGKKMKKIE